MRFIRGHNNRGRSIKQSRYVAEDRGHDSPCWTWQLSTDLAGYGRVKRNGRQLYAHRLMYEERVGPIPPGMEIDHACRNRNCVNPEHLRLVTRAQNAQNVPARAGARGAFWDSRRKRWRAEAKVSNRAHFLGYFDTEAEAAEAARTFRQHSMPFATD